MGTGKALDNLDMLRSNEYSRGAGYSY